MTKLAEFLEILNEKRRVINVSVAVLLVIGVITVNFLVPAMRTAWYIATTDIEYTPHEFKACPPLSEGFVIEKDIFTVDKTIWFCLGEEVPKKTHIIEKGAGRINPTHETEDIAVYFLESNELAQDWKLIASTE